MAPIRIVHVSDTLLSPTHTYFAMNWAAFSVLERAVDRSVITKKSFLLELTSRLFEMPQIRDGLRRLDVDPKAFKAKLEALMEEPAAPENYLAMVEPLAAHAFASAVSAGHDFIFGLAPERFN